MRHEPAGDVDYETGGHAYASIRQPEPAFATAIRAALGDARTLINVGAGAGSYEPADLEVTPVEPSAVMRAQRPSTLAAAVDAVAEDLPFDDLSFDAALASVTVHQWRDLTKGLGEIRRVTRGPVVIMTFDPDALRSFWLGAYVPTLMNYEAGRMPPIATLIDALGGQTAVTALPIPARCRDGFAEAYFGRPEAFLDERVRASQSAWRFIGDDERDAGLSMLAHDLRDGTWDQRFGFLRDAPSFRGALRLLVNTPSRLTPGDRQ